MTTKKPKQKKSKTGGKKARTKTAIAKPSLRERMRLFGFVFAGCLAATGAAFVWLFVDFSALPSQTLGAGQSALRSAGFTVKTLEVSGAKRVDEERIQELIKIDHSATIFGQDIAAMRDRLEAQTWVASARVTRKLPNTLRFDLTEHQPFARWQLNGKIRLVNKAGIPFIMVRLNQWRQLPLIVGPGAGEAVGTLAAALDEHPDIAKRLTSATRVGKRRWDLALRGGTLIKLPEDDIAHKLSQLSRMHTQNALLDGAPMRIDMRMEQMLAISAAPNSEVSGR
ncbi:MAG: FtsQ-type POTRA domain-containing protein [Pseudomonadota bacterium]